MKVEEQIKSLIIKIRQSYLEVGLLKKGIELLIVESLDILFPILKSIMRLAGKKIPRDREGIIIQVSEVIGLSKDVFLNVLFDVQGDERIGDIDADVFLEDYILQLEKIADFVDKYEGK